MKKFLVFMAFILATVSLSAQCITSITTDTTSTSVFIRFTKTSAVKKVALYYTTTVTDTLIGSMTKLAKTYTKSPIVIDQSEFSPGDTFAARLRGYLNSDSIVCTTNKFTFATPSFSIDSCSTPGGLKAFVLAGKAYLSWNSGFCSTYTLTVTEVGGSTATYSSLTVCQKAVPIKSGYDYTWSVKGNCSPTARISEKGTFSTK